MLLLGLKPPKRWAKFFRGAVCPPNSPLPRLAAEGPLIIITIITIIIIILGLGFRVLGRDDFARRALRFLFFN